MYHISYLHFNIGIYHMTCMAPLALHFKRIEKIPVWGPYAIALAGPEKAVRPSCRITYGPHTGILSIAHARCKLKQFCCWINPGFLVKMSDVSGNSEFDYPKKKKKRKKKRKSLLDGGHIIKCLFTELGLARRENIWHSVMVHGPPCIQSVCHYLGPKCCTSTVQHVINN